jgi:hypothetical protein
MGVFKDTEYVFQWQGADGNIFPQFQMQWPCDTVDEILTTNDLETCFNNGQTLYFREGNLV